MQRRGFWISLSQNAGGRNLHSGSWYCRCHLDGLCVAIEPAAEGSKDLSLVVVEKSLNQVANFEVEWESASDAAVGLGSEPALRSRG